MAKNEAKIKFTAETSNFNDSIKKSNDQLGNLRAEMKLNDAQMKTAGTSVEGLQNKHRILYEQLATSMDKTEALSAKVQKASEIFGDDSVEVSKLRTQLLNAQTAEEKLKQAITACEKEIQEQKNAANQTESATEQLTNTIKDQQDALDQMKSEYMDAVLESGKFSKEARTLKKSINDLSGELKDNQTKMNNLSNKADDLDQTLDRAGDAAKDAGDGFTVMKGTLADLASSGIQTAIGGLGDLVGSLGDVVEETKEYRTIMASLEQSSNLAGYSTEETSATLEKLNGVLGDTQSAATTTANLQAIGLEQGKLQTLTDGVIGAWSKYGDSIPIDGLAEAVNETVKAGQVTGNFADLLNWGAKEGETYGVKMKAATKENEAWNKAVEDAKTAEDFFNLALSECSTESERANLIMQAMADQGLAKMGESWQENNKEIVDANNAQAKYEAQTAELADRITPVTTAVKEGFTGILEETLNLTDGVDFEAFGETISSAFGDFAENVLPNIVDGVADVIEGVKESIDWLNQHKAVVAIVAGVIGVLTTAIGIYNIVQGVKNAMDAVNVTTVWGLVAAHAAQAVAAMAAIAPYILIVAAIAAVIAIIILCVKYWDEIVAAVKKAWAIVKETISNVVEAVKTKVSQIWQKIKETTKTVFDSVKNTVSRVWNGIKTAVANAVNAVKTRVVNIWTAIKTTTQNVFNGVKNTLSNIWNGIRNTISNVVNGIKSRISNVFNSVRSTISSIFNGIRSVASSVWNRIKSAIVTPIESAKSKIQGIVNTIKGFFSNMHISLPKIKLPHISVSGGKAPYGIGGIGSLPKFNIEWYAKGAVLKRPTIFGVNGESLMGGGEAGAEAVLPISTLQDYIDNAFARNLPALAVAGAASGDTYNFYVNDAQINGTEEMKTVAKDFITELVRLGGM